MSSPDSTYYVAQYVGTNDPALRYMPQAEQGPAFEGLSLYHGILRCAEEYPGRVIDHGMFPPIPADRSGMDYIPGAHDIFRDKEHGSREGRDAVLEIVRDVRRGRVMDRQVLEKLIGELDAAHHAAGVRKHVEAEDLNEGVRQMFRRMALESGDYNAVKWGLVLGYVHPADAERNEMAVLARHSEFTSYVCRSLRTSGLEDDVVRSVLHGLLPVTEGWGLCRVIVELAAIYGAAGPPLEIQRDIVIHGTRNAGLIPGILMDTILDTASPGELSPIAKRDSELGMGLLRLLRMYWKRWENSTIVSGHEEFSAWHEPFLDVFDTLEPSLELLHMCVELGALADREPSRQALISPERVRACFDRCLSADLLRSGLPTPEWREFVLRVTDMLRVRELCPDLLSLFQQDPQPDVVHTLAVLLEGDERAVLLNALPTEHALNVRDTQERISGATVFDEEAGRSLEPESSGYGRFLENERGDYEDDDANDEDQEEWGEIFSVEMDPATLLYATVVQYLGPIDDHRAFTAIKRAARDYHPDVRAAAFIAMLDIDERRLDAECRALIDDGLQETNMLVWYKAEAAAQRFGLIET